MSRRVGTAAGANEVSGSGGGDGSGGGAPTDESSHIQQQLHQILRDQSNLTQITDPANGIDPDLGAAAEGGDGLLETHHQQQQGKRLGKRARNATSIGPEDDDMKQQDGEGVEIAGEGVDDLPMHRKVPRTTAHAPPAGKLFTVIDAPDEEMRPFPSPDERFKTPLEAKNRMIGYAFHQGFQVRVRSSNDTTVYFVCACEGNEQSSRKKGWLIDM
jgi:hypothetical protein